jgi:hypothetical protein
MNDRILIDTLEKKFLDMVENKKRRELILSFL